MTSGDPLGSFNPMLGPWSRGAVCGDRCLPGELAPTPRIRALSGEGWQTTKKSPPNPADRFQTRPVTPSTGGNTGMVEGALPGQTGAIFHFRPYLPISGEGKGLKKKYSPPTNGVRHPPFPPSPR